MTAKGRASLITKGVLVQTSVAIPLRKEAIPIPMATARSLKIGFLWHCVYPWDVRMEKLVAACRERGHEACVVSKGRSDLPQADSYHGANIVRVMGGGSSFPAWAVKAASYPFFFNPFWRTAALEAFRTHQVDVIIVRDLPLAMLAVWLGSSLNRPVIIDMAENYPAALQAYQNPLYRPALFNHAWLPRKYEAASLARLQHVFVVAEEQRQRLVTAGVDSGKISLVGNTPTDDFMTSIPNQGDDLVTNGECRLLYVGKLDRHRGVDLLIQAMYPLLIEFPNLQLTLVGDGKDKARLEALALELHVDKAVTFTGWLEHKTIARFILESTICLIPHLRCEHTNTTLPNKLFDYMAYSKPTLASNCLPLERIITDENCGTTFRSGDAVSLQAAIRSMLRDPDLKTKGLNGRRAVEHKYNWNMDKMAFVNGIEKLGYGQCAP